MEQADSIGPKGGPQAASRGAQPGNSRLGRGGGRGWWDPGSTAKGDIFRLVQYLNPGLNFGEVRKVLRPFIGLSPSYPIHEKRSAKNRPDVPFGVKWDRRPVPARGFPTRRYLTETRQLPAPVVVVAIRAGALREGPCASAWSAHRDPDPRLTGIEMRGPAYRGFSPRPCSACRGDCPPVPCRCAACWWPGRSTR
jgi:hypothetical protein